MARDQNGPAFALALSKAMVSRAKTNVYVAGLAEVSEVHIGDLRRGERRPTVALIDKIADALVLERWERVELHKAAACDQGYQING